MTPLLPLESFREIIGFHPFHFWQLANSTVPVTSECNGIVYQYNWQNVQTEGRREIAEAIENAESLLSKYLYFNVAPKYNEKTLKYPEYTASWIASSGSRIDGKWLGIHLSDGYVQALGIEQKTLIDTVNVVYSSEYGTLDDTFTLTVTLPAGVTDTNEIAVYFEESDRLDSEGATDRWRIQPVKIEISGTTATIIGRSWLLVKPVLYENIPAINIDPANANNFVTEVEVYRRYTKTDGQTNETSQGLLIWESYPSNWTLCCGGSSSGNESDPGSIASMIARVGVRDAQHGIVIPGGASYNSTTGLWSAVNWSACTAPDRVTIRYLAGYPLVSGQMSKEWQMTVARLALAELDGPICACKAANKSIYRWQVDAARTEGNGDEVLGAISQEDLNNPFGTRRGHIYAWRRVVQHRQLKGFVV